MSEASSNSTLTKFIAHLFFVIVCLLIDIGAHVYGWGLQIRSLWWIIGLGFFGQIFVKLVWDKIK